jgi:hypothetical protein
MATRKQIADRAAERADADAAKADAAAAKADAKADAEVEADEPVEDIGAGDVVFHAASGRYGLVVRSSTTHERGDGSVRMTVDDDGDEVEAAPHLVVAWFGEMSDPIDPADLATVEA